MEKDKLYWSFPDGNISDLVDRRVDSLQNTKRKLQFHSSLVRRLALERRMEGHSGCVNAISWNEKGSLLISGSDDTKINIWNYEDRKLKHSIDTGHSANIFCTKFVPETSDEVVVSGAGDAEVRVFNLSRISGRRSQELSPIPAALYRCHTRRVKKLAVETGNPNVIWSASEDGTLRQHDFRECSSCPPAGSTTQECRNVLIDLRNGAKKSLASSPRQCLSLKSCDISTTRPHQILIGGSDAFGRLYDRRMLPPLSSCRTSSKPPPCVAYFCPLHLSEHQRKSSIHLTHVAFSPNGEEALLSYSGEHVYLMDINTDDNKNTMRYSVDDIKKHLYVPPFPSVPEINSLRLSAKNVNSPSKYDLKRVEVRKKLVQVASTCLEKDKGSDYLYGIEACNEVLDAKGLDIDPLLKHDCLCIRAALFLKRKWKNDVYMAIRDCNSARILDVSSFNAHYYMAEALLQLGRMKEALEYANVAEGLSESKSYIKKVQALKEKIANVEIKKKKRKQEQSTRNTVRRARLRSLSDVLFAASEMTSPSHHHDNRSNNNDERAEEDENGTENEEEDNEMEFDFETSLSENESESEVVRGSLNVRIHQNNDENSDEIEDDGSLSQSEVIGIDMKQRYVGHCNVGTDIKQASFLGQKGEFIASGSDDGKWFIWEKQTGRLVKMLTGDEAVVNCIQAHPFDCAVATSGIDNTIKMWTPCSEEPSIISGGVVGPETSQILQAIKGNQHQLTHNREVMLPLELLERFHMHEFAQSFECTQS